MTDTSKPDVPEAPSSPPLLDGIESPLDLKGLPVEALPQLCTEMRDFLLTSVQETGGHLGSNLGVVELSVALHYVFDFRRDRVIWDVSHQCYPHKILTGRRKNFDKLRRTGGMCGFTNPAESEYDLFHTGHAGTSISLGLGLAMGNSHEANPPHVVSVIGDASLGAGVAFEALNHAGASGQRMLVVLNDNEWSISKTVGSLARYLSRIRSNRLIQRAGQETKNLINAIPVIGPRVDRTLEQIGEVMRHAVVPGHVFEELGVTYVGPIDGHNVDELVSTLERVRELDGAVLLHLLTDKGRGHPEAPGHPERVHAVKPTQIKKAEPAKDAVRAFYKPEAPKVDSAPKATSYTKAFADSLAQLAEGDLRVHAITAAMPSGTGLTAFAERFPARFHDTGITEQHAVGLAAGMAKAGLRPVAAIYSTFLQRGYDQVFQEVVLQGLPVVFCLDRAGLVGQDGPTHNGVFDLAYLRTMPGIELCAPRDATDMRRMLAYAVRREGPTAIRFPRGNCMLREQIPELERQPVQAGKAEVLREGETVVLWAYGALVEEALAAADHLSRNGIEVGVVDARFCKPLDVGLLSEHVSRYRHVITVEEHQRAGGFGSAILEAVSRMPQRSEGIARVRTLGIGDHFSEHKTSREEQLADAGIDMAGILRTVQSLVRTKLV